MNGALHPRRMRKLLLSTSILALVLLAGCSGSGGNGNGGGGPAAASGAAGGTGGGGGANDPCSHGVRPGDPGVADVTCGGTADVKIQVGNVSKDLRGGTCHNVPGQVWTVSVGVIVDITGQHGTYAGPQVDSIEAFTNGNNGGTVEGTLDAKMILSSDDTKITVSPDGKSAHVEGIGGQNSDTPNAKITVDVTC